MYCSKLMTWLKRERKCYFGLDTLVETFTHPTYRCAYISNFFPPDNFILNCQLPFLDLLEYYLPEAKYWLSWLNGKTPTEFNIIRILFTLSSYPCILEYFFLAFKLFLQDWFSFIACWHLNHCKVLQLCILYMKIFECHLSLVLSVKSVYFQKHLKSKVKYIIVRATMYRMCVSLAKYKGTTTHGRSRLLGWSN